MTRFFPATARELAVIVFASLAWFVAITGFASGAEHSGPGRLIGVDQVPHIFDIVADPAEPDSALLATSDGLYRARHDGMAERVSRKQNPFWSLSVRNANGTRLLARGFSDDTRSEAIVVSEDRGRSWQGLVSKSDGPNHIRVVEDSKANPSVTYVAGHAFWESTDGGQSWVLKGVPPSRILDLAASASDPQRIFAATMSDLHVSDDGGLSWRPTGGARCWQPVMAVDTGNDGTVYAFSLCAGFIRGDEATNTWTVVNDRFGGCIIQHLSVDPRNSAQVYAVLGCRKVLLSVDAGLTWRVLGSQRAWEPGCVTNSTGYAEPDNS